MNKNANILLVHGAWADGSCWSKVLLLLRDKGYNVTAAQIPLTSLADDIAVTKRLLSAQKEPTVLVGHSYGGAVITGAANDMPQVKALVYITAFGLDTGESLASLSKQGPPPPAPLPWKETTMAFSGSIARSFTTRLPPMLPMMKPISWRPCRSRSMWPPSAPKKQHRPGKPSLPGIWFAPTTK